MSNLKIAVFILSYANLNAKIETIEAKYFEALIDEDIDPLNKHTKLFNTNEVEAVNQYVAELETLVLIGGIK